LPVAKSGGLFILVAFDMYWIKFFISAVIIILAGIRLTVCADKLSDEMQFGKVWAGIILLGVATSLPEAVASLTAVLSLHANDLAIGNLLGSNNFNPMLIVVMDVLYRQGSVTNALKPNVSHQVSARFAILLTFLVILDIMFNGAFPAFHVGPLSIGGVLILIFYFTGIKRLAKLGAEQAVITPIRNPEAEGRSSITGLWVQLAFSAAFVVVGAMWLAESADVIALQTGLGRTFVGSIFLAIVTSLPEMVVSLSALRLGSLDLAIGNIFGSNMANMFIVFICGLVHRGGPILGAVSPTHMFTAALSILLMHVAIKGISKQGKKTVFGLGWDSLAMLLIFGLGTAFLYHIRAL
jgi:cation:H+ antiporter